MGIACFFVFAIMVDYAAKNPQMETAIFLLGGVIVTGIINLAVAQIQTYTSETRAERQIELARKDRISDLRREAMHRRINQSEENLKNVIDDFSEMERAITYLKLSLQDSSPLSREKFISIVKTSNLARDEIHPKIRQISMPVAALGDKELNDTWTNTLQINVDMNHLYTNFTDKFYELFEEADQISGIENLPEADTSSLQNKLHLLAAIYARALDRIWASDFDVN